VLQAGAGSGQGQKRPRDGTALPDERKEKRARLDEGRDTERAKVVDKAKGAKEEVKVAKPAAPPKQKGQFSQIAEAAAEAQKAKLSSDAYKRLFLTKEQQMAKPNLCSSKPLSANPTFL
jgi:hypothetical protein